MNLDQFDIYIGDTLIVKSDFIRNGKNLNQEKSKQLQFKPISNGDKKAYYLNGQLHSVGTIKSLTKNGFWEFWHSNGKKAREGKFVDGKPDGTHKYWYDNGIFRGIGNWKKGIYEGLWETYNTEGKDKKSEIYKDGIKVE